MARMSRLSRRDFARAATAVAGAALLPRPTAAQPATVSAHERAPVKLPAAAQSEADARVAMLLARWSARLTPPERAAVATLVARSQAALETLRAAPLDIGDAPAPQFHVLRKKH
jgi:hypothetical protein